MTTADSCYDDIYDKPVEVALQETLIRLEGLRGPASIHQLPSSSDRRIVEALRLNARLIQAGSERPSTGTISIGRIFSHVGRSTLALRLVAAMAALSIVISSVFIFGGVASGPPASVSAAALVLSRAARFSVGQGNYAQFTYVVSFGGGRWGRPMTGGNQIWVRGRSSLGPEVEAASVGIPSIRVRDGQLGGYGGWELVIGDAAYEGANDVPNTAFPDLCTPSICLRRTS